MKTILAITFFVSSAYSIAQELTTPLQESETKSEVTSEDEVMAFPDGVPTFPGGSEAMNAYIQNNIRYPEVSRQQGDDGKVYVTFVVERDGSLSGVEATRGGLTPELNAEAVRLVSSMPAWTPAQHEGSAVRARCRLSVPFRLVSPEKETKRKRKRKRKN